MPACLTFCFSDRASRVEFLEVDQVTIGRGDDHAIQLSEPSVSRSHARIEFREGVWWLLDLASKNGVFVEGHRVQEAALPDHGWFRLGDVSCEFETVTSEQLRRRQARGQHRLSQSMAFSRQLSAIDNSLGILKQTLESMLAVVQMSRGFVLTNGKRGWEVSIRHGIEASDLAADGFEGSVSAVERCRSTAATVMAFSIDPNHWLAQQASVVRNRITALTCVPLKVGDSLAGVVYLDSETATTPLTELDVNILESLASQAAMALAMTALDQSINAVEAELKREEAARRSMQTVNIPLFSSSDGPPSGDTVAWDDLIQN